MPSLDYSRISPSDEGFLLGLYASVRADEMAVVPWSEEQKKMFIESQFKAQQEHYFSKYPEGNFNIIKLGDRKVGRFYVCELDDEIRIIDLTIASEFRGRGIGTQIITKTINSTSKKVRIYLESFNRSAALFSRLGFSQVNEEGVYCLWERPVPSETELFAVSN